MIPEWAGYLAFRDAFGEVMDPRLYTLDWLDLQILEGRARFWRSENAALVVELKFYPTGAADAHVLIAAGDASEIVTELRPQAEEWAKRMGCIGALVASREGWGRMLKDAGYEPHQTILRKDF